VKLRLLGHAPRLPQTPLLLLDQSIAPNSGEKTRIWWLPRVRRVLDLWPKIRTVGVSYPGSKKTQN
jgi:hypothetical protein